MEAKVKLIVPITTKEMIAPVTFEGADILYTGYGKFVRQGKFNFDLLKEFADEAKAHRIKLFLSLGPEIFESHFKILEKAFVDLTKEHVDGLILNNYSLLTLLKEIKKPGNFPEIFMGRGLNLHNIASCELVSTWRPAALNITEEVYLKNVTKIKEHTAKDVFISINDTIWLLNYALDWGIDNFIIYGKYNEIDHLCLLISSLRELLDKVKAKDEFDNQLTERVVNLLDSSDTEKQFKTDHFTRKFKDYNGKDFEFTGNIKHFGWNRDSIVSDVKKIPAINKKNTRLRLRLTRLEQIRALEPFIKAQSQNIVDIIEFGDIISPKELSKQRYEDIVIDVRAFCTKYNIDLFLTTPSILIERDIDNVAATVKSLCSKQTKPAGLVINNPGLWKYISKSKVFDNLFIELGDGLEIYNSRSIQFFQRSHRVNGVNIPNNLDFRFIEKLVNNANIDMRSLVIAGISKLKTSGLCPLNNDLAIVSRLECMAPCQKTSYAITDPFTGKVYPMILDGFCRFHLVKSYLDDHLQFINRYIESGITDFILDCRGLPSEMLLPLIERYCSAISSPENYIPISLPSESQQDPIIVS